MTDRKAYIFVTTKRAGDTTVALQHHEQFVPRGEKILLTDEDYERLKSDYELRPVTSQPVPVVPAPASATSTFERPTTSVARSSIPVKPSSDDESPNAAL